jgi:3-oxoacyl-[acyl-carrier protein] reductase
MQDKYLDFVGSGFGKWLSANLGLPQPVPLRRYRTGEPEFVGPFLMGAAPGGAMRDTLAALFAEIEVPTRFHESDPEWLGAANRHGQITGRFVAPTGKDGDASDRIGGIVFDATGITSVDGLDALYHVFHDGVRAIGQCGRVVVIGRPPEGCKAPEAAIAQRALEGLTRSLGKEIRRGCTAQLVYVTDGAEDVAASTLRFLLSARSAYVSGQVVRVRPAPVVSLDWQKPLAGRTALVTGASRGIGAAIAQVLARDGARVLCLDVPAAQDNLNAVAREVDGEALVYDIAAPETPALLAQQLSALGGVDILVHNAGITRDKTIARMTEPAWRNVLDINLSAQLRINDALLGAKALRAGGAIVCVSSISGIAGNLGQTNYATSKAGVIGLVQASAPLLAECGITINAVAPGFIETQMTAAVPFAIREAGRRMNAMSQGGQPVDVAETIAWFANPASNGVTGNVVRVCGQSLLGA